MVAISPLLVVSYAGAFCRVVLSGGGDAGVWLRAAAFAPEAVLGWPGGRT